jgi:ElaB/YqjD/DUF883 family membrane-anchored ribosome-binding protein
MNDRQYERKVEQDAAKAKKNISNLIGNSVDQIESKVEAIADSAKETYNNTSATVKKDVEHGLGLYNAKAQEYAEKIPGGLAEKAAKYPWVAITIGLGIGVLLGGLLKPSRRS